MDAEKPCRKCGELKKLVQFAWENEKKGIKKNYCRDCMRQYHLKWYGKYKKGLAYGVLRDRQMVKIKRARIWKLTYLQSHPCIDCKEDDPVVLDFDHTIKDKWNINSRIYRLVARGYGVDRLEQEAKKCVVRCANCHRRKTAKEQGWYKTLPKEVLDDQDQM